MPANADTPNGYAIKSVEFKKYLYPAAPNIFMRDLPYVWFIEPVGEFFTYVLLPSIYALSSTYIKMYRIRTDKHDMDVKFWGPTPHGDVSSS